MINFPAVCIANGIAVLLMIIIVISERNPVSHGLFDSKIYYSMVSLTILQCIGETATFFIDGKMLTGYHALSMILNTALYVFNVLFAFLWTVYADYKLFRSEARIKKIYPYVFIPAFGIMAGCVVNFFTPVFFTVNSQNIYQRTGLYIIPYIVTYFYLAFGVVMIYVYRKKVKQYLFLPAIIFMIPILTGSLLQYFFYGYSLVWAGVAIALVSLYVNVQNEASYIDTLSGLLNRQFMDNYLNAESKKSESSQLLAGIMLDIDRFKSINDRFGHLTGDEAISKVGAILHSVVGEAGLSCRYAGDEFVVIKYVKDEKEIKDLIAAVRKKMEDFNQNSEALYTLQFSVGYTTYKWGDDTVDNFLRRMDQGMYLDKKDRIARKIIPDSRR